MNESTYDQLRLITQLSPYIVQNPDGFFISGVIFCFCFYSFDGKNKSLCYTKVSIVAREGRKNLSTILLTTPPEILPSSVVETRYPVWIIKKAWITPW